MKRNLKRTLFSLTLVLALVLTSVAAFADDAQSILSKVTGVSDKEIQDLRDQGIGYGQIIPASIIAKKANISLKDAVALRQAGKTYYQIAEDKNIKVEDYKNELLKARNAYIDEQVKAGTITETRAKLIKERISTAIENCDGTSSGSCRLNGGFGRGNGSGKGMGQGRMGGGFGAGCGVGCTTAN